MKQRRSIVINHLPLLLIIESKLLVWLEVPIRELDVVSSKPVYSIIFRVFFCELLHSLAFHGPAQRGALQAPGARTGACSAV